MAERQRRADAELSTSPLRVLFVGHRFPPDGSGGYELHCAAVRSYLQSRGHTVRVLASARGEGPWPAQPGVSRVLGWHASGTPLAREPAWDFERHNRAALDAELDSLAPDAVCFWRLGETSLSLVEQVFERGIPALGYVGDGWLHEGAQRDPWTPHRGRPLPLGDLATWVFNSSWLRDSTQAAGVALRTSRVITPGVDRRVFAPGALDERRSWRGRLLCAGRLTPAKGVDVALRALARLPGCQLLMVGDGSPEHLDELSALAVALGVDDRVVRRPAVAPETLAGLYRDADALLFPVRWQEPFGLVPLEAMACGLPVVATGTGGSGEYLVDGGNALVVAPGDEMALADAVMRLAGDPALRRRLRDHGLDTAARHDRDESSAALERLLCRLARGGAVPGGAAADTPEGEGERATG